MPSLKDADSLFSKWIIARDEMCVRCYSREDLQCSHYKNRWKMSTRFHPDNCDTLCFNCHLGDDGWEYKKESEYKQFKIRQIGIERFNALIKLSNTTISKIQAIKSCIDFVKNPPI